MSQDPVLQTLARAHREIAIQMIADVPTGPTLGDCNASSNGDTDGDGDSDKAVHKMIELFCRSFMLIGCVIKLIILCSLIALEVFKLRIASFGLQSLLNHFRYISGNQTFVRFMLGT